MAHNTWTPEELRVCSVAYRRRGAETAAQILRLLGFFRTPAAIRDKMRKLGVGFHTAGGVR